MNREITLGTKLVGNITGDFYVPSYQRGYRWGKPEVERLLDDIYSTKGDINYCLQPVVVKKNDDGYELIDGQQRLTTIYLIYRFMSEHSKSINGPRFTLSYETRKKSKDFLKSIDESRKEENIDFWFFCSAYESIKAWFSKKDRKSTLTNMNKYFDEIVKIIWYEVEESEDAIGLFTRLNIGKIPLTNAELVKAMFLSKGRTDTNMERKKQEEISFQWDHMEKELHNDSLWFFLTNKSTEYQTRADLVLDLISQKPTDNRDKYYTFFKFNEMYQDGKNLDDIWYEIQQTFLTLKEWHSNHEFYHKIGYLIASGSKTLRDIFELSQKDETKSAFKKSLDKDIKNSIKIGKNYADLSYENTEDQKKIKRLLLLFNVESVRKSGEHSQRFPFDKYKNGKDGSVIWSLEHIHAQQSEGLSTQKMWQEWLKLHIPSIKSISHDSELIKRMGDASSNDSLSRQDFDSLQQEVVGLLSEKGHSEYLHSIANLALLSSGDNAALSNSTFDVKRTEIIKMDKKGAFIPFCTRMVFLKYYTSSDKNQLHFWGEEDRKEYVAEMNRILKDYLEEEISSEKETK
jgi:raw score 3.25